MRSKTVARTLFRDPWSPTREEVVRWAYTERAPAPDQDFQLAIIYHTELHATVLRCAADHLCPKQRFFLGCLYVLVGDAVRSSWDSFSKPAIERLIQQGRESSEPDVQLWTQRAQALVDDPATYSYEEWGLGSRLVYVTAPSKSNKHKRHHTKSKPEP